MLRLLVFAALAVTAAHAAASVRARSAPDASWSPDAWTWTQDDLEEGAPIDPEFIDEPSQLPDPFEAAAIMFSPSTHIPAPVSPDVAQRNLRATLDAIAFCEGTSGPEGYRTMFGYRYFDSFDDHPRQYWPYTNLAGKTIRTSAAGRYQIIVATWDALRARLNLPDFSPASQDAAAVELIRERGALQDAYAGRIQVVADKCRGTWASLPGSNVAQPTRTMASVIAAYQGAGGALA